MATQADWLKKLGAVQALGAERAARSVPQPTAADWAAAVEKQRGQRAAQTRQSGQADLFAPQGELFAGRREQQAPAARAAPPEPETEPEPEPETEPEPPRRGVTPATLARWVKAANTAPAPGTPASRATYIRNAATRARRNLAAAGLDAKGEPAAREPERQQLNQGELFERDAKGR